jgi:hypothetical protein
MIRNLSVWYFPLANRQVRLTKIPEELLGGSEASRLLFGADSSG